MIDAHADGSETEKMSLPQKVFILGTVAVLSFGMGLFYSMTAKADEDGADRAPAAQTARKKKAPPARKTVVYPKTSEVDFEGMMIKGEVRQPGEFYFQRKQDEKFDSLVKRRKNFQREMLRDVVMTK